MLVFVPVTISLLAISATQIAFGTYSDYSLRLDLRAEKSRITGHANPRRGAGKQ